ncbi:MAG: cytochrome c3 family protein [Acidobacteria bacterium]|nr:cytochrome c3 family protein [Acidobacteriota bacterium]
MAISRNSALSLTSVRLFLLAGFMVLCATLSHGQAKNSCLDCHSTLPDFLGVSQDKFSQDIHSQKGLSCASCHGGDPTSDDPEKAMSRKAGWKGNIDRSQVPQLCGSCHSDPAYIRQFNPSLRTDQLSQYKTSVHGIRLAAGDTKVAVCTDCHSVHDLRTPSDPRSTVNPVNVANTCARCHADAVHMSGYKIPTSQFAQYSKSVHHDALAIRGDLSAPTCTTCHGNHGAAPPGVASVANVCSTCHVFQAQLFESSPHKEAFASAGLPGCVTCHSNHDIVHPTDEFIGIGDKAICTQCHTDGDAGFVAAARMKQQLVKLAGSIDAADQILGRAERSGMEVSQPKLELTQAKDSLIKARVTIHSLNEAKVETNVKPGLETAAKEYDAGKKALAERNHRRVGLGLSLIAIALVLIGLRLYIKRIES